MAPERLLGSLCFTFANKNATVLLLAKCCQLPVLLKLFQVRGQAKMLLFRKPAGPVLTPGSRALKLVSMQVALRCKGGMVQSKRAQVLSRYGPQGANAPPQLPGIVTQHCSVSNHAAREWRAGKTSWNLLAVTLDYVLGSSLPPGKVLRSVCISFKVSVMAGSASLP